MKAPSVLQRGSVGFNMTPMIDVVFLLIIFFLVSSHLAKQEAQLEQPLPTADSGDEPAPAETRRVTVNVLENGAILLAGSTVEPSALTARLQAKVKEAGPDIEIRVRGHRRTAYRHVEKILLACAKAGVWNVNFAVYRPEDVR